MKNFLKETGFKKREVLQYCVYMPSKFIIRLYQRSGQ